MIDEHEHLSKIILARLPNIKGGSLRIWNNWFGKPHDNIYKIIACDTQDSSVRIHFDGGELLQIWNPRNFQVDESTFKIESADRVRWEWWYYGRPAEPQNRMFLDYRRGAGTVTLETNREKSPQTFHVVFPAPAVELL